MKKLILILVSTTVLLTINSSCLAKIVTYRELPCIERTNAQGAKYWKVLRWTKNEIGQFSYYDGAREVPVDSLTFMNPDQLYQANHGFIDPTPAIKAIPAKTKSLFSYLFSQRFLKDFWALAKFVLVLVVVVWLLRKLFAKRQPAQVNNR